MKEFFGVSPEGALGKTKEGRIPTGKLTIFVSDVHGQCDQLKDLTEIRNADIIFIGDILGSNLFSEGQGLYYGLVNKIKDLSRKNGLETNSLLLQNIENIISFDPQIKESAESLQEFIKKLEGKENQELEEDGENTNLSEIVFDAINRQHYGHWFSNLPDKAKEAVKQDVADNLVKFREIISKLVANGNNVRIILGNWEGKRGGIPSEYQADTDVQRLKEAILLPSNERINVAEFLAPTGAEIIDDLKTEEGDNDLKIYLPFSEQIRLAKLTSEELDQDKKLQEVLAQAKKAKKSGKKIQIVTHAEPKGAPHGQKEPDEQFDFSTAGDHQRAIYGTQRLISELKKNEIEISQIVYGHIHAPVDVCPNNGHYALGEATATYLPFPKNHNVHFAVQVGENPVAYIYPNLLLALIAQTSMGFQIDIDNLGGDKINEMRKEVEEVAKNLLNFNSELIQAYLVNVFSGLGLSRELASVLSLISPSEILGKNNQILKKLSPDHESMNLETVLKSLVTDYTKRLEANEKPLGIFARYGLNDQALLLAGLIQANLNLSPDGSLIEPEILELLNNFDLDLDDPRIEYLKLSLLQASLTQPEILFEKLNDSEKTKMQARVRLIFKDWTRAINLAGFNNYEMKANAFLNYGLPEELLPEALNELNKIKIDNLDELIDAIPVVFKKILSESLSLPRRLNEIFLAGGIKVEDEDSIRANPIEVFEPVFKKLGITIKNGKIELPETVWKRLEEYQKEKRYLEYGTAQIILQSIFDFLGGDESAKEKLAPYKGTFDGALSELIGDITDEYSSNLDEEEVVELLVEILTGKDKLKLISNLKRRNKTLSEIAKLNFRQSVLGKYLISPHFLVRKWAQVQMGYNRTDLRHKNHELNLIGFSGRDLT